MISVCKNASRYHSVPGMWKLKSQGQKKERYYFLIDILLRSVNPLSFQSTLPLSFESDSTAAETQNCSETTLLSAPTTRKEERANAKKKKKE